MFIYSVITTDLQMDSLDISSLKYFQNNISIKLTKGDLRRTLNVFFKILKTLSINSRYAN